VRKTGIRWRGSQSREIPEGVRFAAAVLLFGQIHAPVCAPRPYSNSR